MEPASVHTCENTHSHAHHGHAGQTCHSLLCRSDHAPCQLGPCPAQVWETRACVHSDGAAGQGRAVLGPRAGALSSAPSSTSAVWEQILKAIVRSAMHAVFEAESPTTADRSPQAAPATCTQRLAGSLALPGFLRPFQEKVGSRWLLVHLRFFLRPCNVTALSWRLGRVCMQPAGPQGELAECKR